MLINENDIWLDIWLICSSSIRIRITNFVSNTIYFEKTVVQSIVIWYDWLYNYQSWDFCTLAKLDLTEK